ncbi:MAG: serine/threonine protein kinase, partial [Persicimonas sp.]
MGTITQTTTDGGNASDEPERSDAQQDHDQDLPEVVFHAGSRGAHNHFCATCQAIRRANDSQCPDCLGAPPAQGWPSLDECPDSWLGRSVGQGYVIDQRIGEGAAGVVYRAVSQKVSREFALKIVDPTSDKVLDVAPSQLLRNLSREIDAQSQFKNPHVVHLFDVIELEGNCLGILMDLVDGVTVQHLVEREGPMAVERACHILRQASIGVHEAHEVGLVHRDLKPQNLMVTTLPSGEDFVRVLDFGIICLQNDSDAVNGFVGTPAYASPEQAACERLDRRSDIYSLGVVFFFMLTGQTPFPGASVADVLSAHMRDRSPLLAEAVPASHFPDALEDLVARLLSKNAAERPDTLAQLISEIDGLLSVLPNGSAHRSASGSSRTERSNVETVPGDDEPDPLGLTPQRHPEGIEELVGVSEPSSPSDLVADGGAPTLAGMPVREVVVPGSLIDQAWTLTPDERIIYLHPQGELKLVDSALDTEWAIDLGLDAHPTAITLAPDAAFIATVDGQLHEFSPSFEHRRHLWTTPDGATPGSLSCDVAGEWVALVTEQGDAFVGRLAADGTGEWRRLGLSANT